jgi:uncharacterized delta-60 repeat protein
MGFLTRSSRRQLSTLIQRATSRVAGKLLEPLEDRRLYSTVPTLNVSGPSLVSEGSTYTLALSATGTNFTPIDHWTINWGDSNTTTFAGNPSTATHVYADGPGSAIITASATLTDNTVVPANLGGAASDNGTLDPSFNTTGTVAVNPGGTISFAKGVAVQSDGKIVEAGFTDGVAQIVRFNSDGSLDTTFAGTGKILSDFGVGFVAQAVSMQTVAGQEKILVAGNTGSHSALVRLNLDGSLDSTFGSGGIATFSITGGFFFNHDGVRGMTVMPDGRIVTAGVVFNINNGSSQDIALARFNPDGTLDTTFNPSGPTPGEATLDLGGNNDTALKVLLNPDNSIVVLAQGFTGAGFHSQLLRYTSAGTLDPAFGVGGISTITIGNQFSGEGLAVDAAGNILVSGNTFDPNVGATDAAVARFTPTGTPDATFGSGGVASWLLDFGNDDYSSVSVQSDGNILLGGNSTSFFINGGTGDNFVLARVTSTGAQDSTFGPPADRFGNVGVVRVDFFAGNDDSDALAFTNDGRAILAGAAFNAAGSSSQVALAQFGAAGTGSSPVTVNITNAPPTVSIAGLTATVNEGDSLALGANVTDPSPVDTAAGFTYAWSVAKDNVLYAQGTSSNFVFNPDDNGLYEIHVVVTDKDGGAADDTRDITVNNVAPNVTAVGAPATSPEATPISVSASAADPGPLDTAAGFTTTWSVTKNDSPFAGGTGLSATFTPDDNGTYVLTLSATDKDGATGSSVSTITVTNVAPTVSLTNVPTTGTEGTAISFTAGSSITDPSPVDTAAGFTTTWNVTKNGSPFAAGSGAAISFTPDDNGTYILTLSATDKDGGAGSASSTINVANVAPTITSVSIANSTAVRNQTINFVSTFTDPGTLDNPTAAWDFGDGNSAAGASASHVYTATGTYTVTLTVTDKDGGATSTTRQVTILGVTLAPDPADATKTALYIGGTAGNDNIVVNPGGGSGAGAQVIVNGVTLGVFNLTGHIIVYGGAGDDTIQLSGSLPYPSELFGGAGNDRIKGDNTSNIIVGGDGNDVLVGGTGRDLLIGGSGADQITGGSNDDILIASSTSYDTDSKSLETLMKEWTRTDATFSQRVLDLLYGGGLNGSTTINTSTVFSDASVDTLTGSSGDDLFVFNTNDDLTDFNATQDIGALDLSWIIVPF